MKNSFFLFLLLLSFNNLFSQEYLATAKDKTGWGYIDEKGNWVIQPKFKKADFFSEGLAIVKEDGEYGFIDKKGNWVVKPEYSECREFRNGYAPVVKGPRDWGMIDSSGNIVLNFKYGYLDYFYNGLARFREDLGWGYVDKNGKVLNTIKFGACENFSEGMARVERWHSWGFIDTTGTLAVENKFDNAGDFREGLAWVEYKGKCGFIDKKGNFKIPPKYNVARSFSNGTARVLLKGIWYFIDTTGKVILTLDKKIEQVSTFNGGFARMDLGDIGYIDSKGKIIVQPKYDIGKNFNYGVAAVGAPGDYKLIDSTGTLITKRRFIDLDVCENGFVRACTGEFTGFMDTKGNWIIKPNFYSAGVFVDINRKYGSGPKTPIKEFGIASRPNDFR